MCRVGFLVFSDKLEPWEKCSFITNLLVEQNTNGGHSQGVCLLKKSEDNSHFELVETYKTIGSAAANREVIYKDLMEKFGPFDAALTHNRYATHGGVTMNNCHPITSGKVHVVHNGIFAGYVHFLKPGEVAGGAGNYWDALGGMYRDEPPISSGNHGTSVSDTAVAAQLIEKEGLEVFGRVLIGSGTYVWFDEKLGVVRGLRTGNGNPLELFALMKGEEPMIWGMVSDTDDLPKETTWSFTTRKPILGEVLSIDQTVTKNGLGSFGRLARVAFIGQIYEVIPQGIFRKDKLFEEKETNTTNYSSGYSQRAWDGYSQKIKGQVWDWRQNKFVWPHEVIDPVFNDKDHQGDKKRREYQQAQEDRFDDEGEWIDPDKEITDFFETEEWNKP